MRLAFLTPLPPAPTGVADYSVDVLRLLSSRHEVDVFHDQETIDRDISPPPFHTFRAADFLERHRERAYDLALYQMGNSLHHAFLYPLLARVPGLLVLHDLVLHHSRARTFLKSPEALAYAGDPSSATLRDAARRSIAAYEAEVAHAYPAQAGRLADTYLNTVGDLLPYAYPLFRLPVEAARLTATHNRFMSEAIAAEVPGAETARIAMPVVPGKVDPAAVTELRRTLGIAASDFVVGCFGLITREKRIETVVRAAARAAASHPHVRLLLVGPTPDRSALEARLQALGVRDRTAIAGRVSLDALPAHMEAADLVVHLRYPTARETSAALLRVLGQGRPTVMADLEHLADVPMDAVVRADVTDEEGEVTRAILRLAGRPAERMRLGRVAAAFVAREHSPERCLADYETVITRAVRLPDPPRRPRPAHWPSPTDGKMGA